MTDKTTSTNDGAQASSLAPISPFDAGKVLAVMYGGATGGMDIPKPFAEPILLLEDTRVAGTTHVIGIHELTENLAKGDRLRLERDPKNHYDYWAIRVLDTRGNRLGFVPADCNQIPARLMDGGKSLFAKVTGVELRGSWTRIGMDVYLDD